jgi:hypothetical protein
MACASVHNITKEEEKDPTNHRIYAFYGSSNQLCGKAAWGPLDSSHLRPASQTLYFQMGQRGCSNWVDRRGFLQICSTGMCHYYSCYYNTSTGLCYQGENTSACFAFLQFKDTSISDLTLKDHCEQAVLNQYTARFWASKFRDEVETLVESKMIQMEDLMSMFHPVLGI